MGVSIQRGVTEGSEPGGAHWKLVRFAALMFKQKGRVRACIIGSIC